MTAEQAPQPSERSEDPPKPPDQPAHECVTKKEEEKHRLIDRLISIVLAVLTVLASFAVVRWQLADQESVRHDDQLREHRVALEDFAQYLDNLGLVFDDLHTADVPDNRPTSQAAAAMTHVRAAARQVVVTEPEELDADLQSCDELIMAAARVLRAIPTDDALSWDQLNGALVADDAEPGHDNLDAQVDMIADTAEALARGIQSQVTEADVQDVECEGVAPKR